MVTQTYNIDFTPGAITERVLLSQYDVDSRIIEFNVYDGNDLADLTGYSATIEGTRCDGVAFTVNCTISGSKVTFVPNATMTNRAGDHIAEIVFVNSNEDRIGTRNFIIFVEPAGMDENSSAIEEDQSLYQQYNLATQAQISEINNHLIAPVPVTDSSQMIDTTKTYLYVGIETPIYIPGHWYYYNGSAWADGGAYGASTGIISPNARNLLNYILSKVVYTDPGMEPYVVALDYALKQSAMIDGAHRIIYVMENITSSNIAGTIDDGESFTTTLTPDTGYVIASVTVTMGGVDITATAYNAGVITIASVTADVNIIATYDYALPSGYTAKNYVTGNYNTYAVTNIPESDVYSFEAKFRRTNNSQPNYHVFSGQNLWYPFLGDSAHNVIRYCFGQGNFSNNQLVSEHLINTDYTTYYDKNTNGIYIKGGDYVDKTLVGTAQPSGGYDSSIMCCIGAYGGDQVSQTKYHFVGRIYYIKLWNENGVLTHYFKPVVNNSTSKYGFYDVIGGVFVGAAAGTYSGG